MIQPQSLSVGELANRWKLTPRQVLQHAQGLGVPLYFSFEGLVFADADRWHRDGGDFEAQEELALLTRSIATAERQLQRHKLGKTTHWDALTPEDALELAARVESEKRELNNLTQKVGTRDPERRRHQYRGHLRTTPSTLWDIDTVGSAPFPHEAFDPSVPIKVVTLPEGDLNAGKHWNGHLVTLEPGVGRNQYPKQRLTIDDLFALTAEVKAIESWMRAGLPPEVQHDSSVAASAPAKIAQPGGQGPRFMKAALIARHLSHWPTIARDIKDASANGLRAEAKADGRGWWLEGAAVAWATARGKIIDTDSSPMAALTRTIHKMKR